MKSHPFFADVNWVRMERRLYTPPYMPITGIANCTRRPVCRSYALSKMLSLSCVHHALGGGIVDTNQGPFLQRIQVLSLNPGVGQNIVTYI